VKSMAVWLGQQLETLLSVETAGSVPHEVGHPVAAPVGETEGDPVGNEVRACDSSSSNSNSPLASHTVTAWVLK
jgi:hypothetical protein